MSAKVGGKNFDQMRATDWTVKNVEYQGGLAIPKKHVLYDKTGQINVRLSELAGRTQAHWLTLVAPLIVAGESTVCYDGQYFFDTDHSEGDSGTQSNDISADISAYPTSNHGSTTQPSAGEMVFAIMDGIKQMVAFKDDRGEYCNEDKTEFLVLTGQGLMAAAMSALRAKSVDGGDDNILFEQDNFNIRMAASPRFSAWTTKFAIFATQGAQKPIIRQQRLPNNAGGGYNMDGLSYDSLWLDSEHCVKNDECLITVETERAAAYGDWKKGCLVTLV